jgi:hypothetical protein
MKLYIEVMKASSDGRYRTKDRDVSASLHALTTEKDYTIYGLYSRRDVAIESARMTGLGSQSAVIEIDTTVLFPSEMTEGGGRLIWTTQGGEIT